MLRVTPPFRADHVGSLLRPQYLKDARAQRSRGEITPQQLREIEDRAVREVISKQESVGLEGITDGELRRSFWHLDFLEHLTGVECYPAEQGLAFKGGTARIKGMKVTGKIQAGVHPMIEDFKYLKHNVPRKTAKATIPSPSVLPYRAGRKAVSETVYPTMGEFYHDLGQTYRKIVADFGAAGCRYLQLDEVSLTYLCDEEQRHMLRSRDEEPDKLPAIYADMINAAVSGRTPEMRVMMHLCRGNFRSMWMASGGYEPVADVLFNTIHVDGYLMEWDTDRAGSFKPLHLVPKNKQVVLGIVTSKTGTLENKDDLKRRIDEAAKFIDLDQLCLSPQCGFASTEEGNVLTEDQQWAKLRLVVEVAHEVWG